MNNTITILYVEDDRIDQMAFERFFKNQPFEYSYTIVGSVADAISRVKSQQYDIIISDYQLGDGNLFDFILHVKETPVIVITGTGDEEIAVEAMKKGVSDYLIKDPDGHYLKIVPPTINNALNRKKTENEVKKYQEHLEELVAERTSELVESQEKFCSLVKNAPIVVLVLSQDYCIQEFNDEAESLYGKKREEVLGQNYLNLFIPEYERANIKQDIQKVLRGTPTRGFVNALIDANGRRHQVSWNVDRLRSTSSETVEVIAVGIDITERVEAERKIRESEQKHRRLVENLQGSFLYQHDLDGIFTYVSPSITQMLGYSIDEFKRHYLEYVTDNSSNKNVIEFTELCMKGIKQPRYELQIFHKDKSVRWLEINEIPVRDEQGNVIAVEGIAHDITERKDLVAQLRQSEKMQAFGQLAGGVAHDLNNQLGGVIGFADMLAECLEDDELRKYANNILICGNRGAKLIRQLLDFSRKGDYQCIPVAIHKIIKEVIEILERSIDKQIVIKQELHATSDMVEGDPTMFQNALLNLAVNARDAMPFGGKLVFTTSLQELDADYCSNNPYEIIPGNYLLVSVTDNGTGIAKKNLDHIFEPFFTTKEKGKGTGMGLAAVYGTVKQHKGAINVYSELDRGTIFKLYLPLMSKENDLIRLNLQKVIKAEKEFHVIVIEDEEFVRNSTVTMLKRLGYKVNSFENGESAVEYYKNNWQDIDLVLLDIIMPVMGGKETYTALKKINPLVKVVVCSGFSNGAIEELMQYGAVSFILKPCSYAELSNKVASAIQGSKSLHSVE